MKKHMLRIAIILLIAGIESLYAQTPSTPKREERWHYDHPSLLAGFPPLLTAYTDYDAQGRVIEEATIEASVEDTHEIKKVTVWSEDGKQNVVKEYLDGWQAKAYVTKFNNHGKPAQVWTISHRGDTISKQTMLYEGAWMTFHEEIKYYDGHVDEHVIRTLVMTDAGYPSEELVEYLAPIKFRYRFGTYTYDAAQDRLKVVHYDNFNTDLITNSIEYQGKTDERPVTLIEFEDDRPIRSTHITYNERGLPLKDSTYQYATHFSLVHEHEYDANGNLLSILTHRPVREAIEERIWLEEHDDQGRVTKRYFKKPSYDNIKTWRYSPDGKVLEINEGFTNLGPIQKEWFVYDERGRLLAEYDIRMKVEDHITEVKDSSWEIPDVIPGSVIVTDTFSEKYSHDENDSINMELFVAYPFWMEYAYDDDNSVEKWKFATPVWFDVTLRPHKLLSKKKKKGEIIQVHSYAGPFGHTILRESRTRAEKLVSIIERDSLGYPLIQYFPPESGKKCMLLNHYADYRTVGDTVYKHAVFWDDYSYYMQTNKTYVDGKLVYEDWGDDEIVRNIYTYLPDGRLYAKRHIPPSERYMAEPRLVLYDYNEKGWITKKHEFGEFFDPYNYLEYTYHGDGTRSVTKKNGPVLEKEVVKRVGW